MNFYIDLFIRISIVVFIAYIFYDINKKANERQKGKDSHDDIQVFINLDADADQQVNETPPSPGPYQGSEWSASEPPVSPTGTATPSPESAGSCNEAAS